VNRRGFPKIVNISQHLRAGVEIMLQRLPSSSIRLVQRQGIGEARKLLPKRNRQYHKVRMARTRCPTHQSLRWRMTPLPHIVSRGRRRIVLLPRVARCDLFRRAFFLLELFQSGFLLWGIYMAFVEVLCRKVKMM
jgi:hypothetical protein